MPDLRQSGRAPGRRELLLKLSEFQGRLLQLYDRSPEFITPEIRRNEIKTFVAEACAI